MLIFYFVSYFASGVNLLITMKVENLLIFLNILFCYKMGEMQKLCWDELQIKYVSLLPHFFPVTFWLQQCWIFGRKALNKLTVVGWSQFCDAWDDINTKWQWLIEDCTSAGKCLEILWLLLSIIYNSCNIKSFRLSGQYFLWLDSLETPPLLSSSLLPLTSCKDSGRMNSA